MKLLLLLKLAILDAEVYLWTEMFSIIQLASLFCKDELASGQMTQNAVCLSKMAHFERLAEFFANN